MKTTITVVDPFRGTVVVETEGNAEVVVDGNSTSVKVNGERWEDPLIKALAEPEPVQIRTPEPEEQTMSVKTGDGKQLPQKEAPNDAPVAPVRDETPKDDPEPSPKPKKQPEAHVHVEKDCANCGEPFTASGTGSSKRKFCDNCKDIPAYKRKGNGRPTGASLEPVGPNGDQPEGKWWCIHHKSWQEHKSPECPIIDEDKTPAQRAAAATEAAGVGEAFTDPWNCARCRDEQHLCRFHRQMEASGSKPPRIRPQ